MRFAPVRCAHGLCFAPWFGYAFAPGSTGRLSAGRVTEPVPTDPNNAEVNAMNQPQVIELQQVVGNITDSLGRVFDCMEVAECEIDAAKGRTRNEDERNAIHGSFR